MAADDNTLLAVDETMAKLAKEDPDSAEFLKLLAGNGHACLRVETVRHPS